MIANHSIKQLVHPATLQLLSAQSKAKLSRIFSSFHNPRRRLLSYAAVILGGIWLSQIIMAVFLRPATDPSRLMVWIPFSLFVYSAWHIIKTVTNSELVPFEWTPADNELVRTAPISRTQLISYRMAAILSAGLSKAICFSIVMLPDLKIFILGVVGMFLALVFVDLIRVAFELFFDALGKRTQLFVKLSVLGCAFAVGGYVIYTAVTADGSGNGPASIEFLKNAFGSFIGLSATTPGQILTSPFSVFAHLIFAQEFSSQLVGYFVLANVLVVGLAGLVYQLDGWRLKCVSRKEHDACERGLLRIGEAAMAASHQSGRFVAPLRLSGAGPIIWRQMCGAWNYRATLAISLGVPTLLCCLPLLEMSPSIQMLLNITAALVFYSFLLLPAALMLDFRRDINRMYVLKSLPCDPMVITCAQLATPVLLCCGFQWLVLLISSAAGPVVWWQALVAAVLLMPVNVLIFAIENFIFLFAPYQRSKEGLDVFLRTILVFTGKGIGFAMALAGVIVWAFVSNWIAGGLNDSVMLRGIVFVGGLWIAVCAMAMGATITVRNLFVRFDPSQDVPAES